AHHPERPHHGGGLLPPAHRQPERVEDARDAPPRGDRVDRGDRRGGDRGVRGGRGHLARARGQDHARHRRGDAAHHAAGRAGGMRLPSVRLRRAAPPPIPSDGEGRSLRTSWRPAVPYRRRLGEIVRHNWGLKLVSAFLACFLWYSINELERDAERVVDLPVAIRKVPAGLIVTELSPAKGVTVTLRGPRTILDSVDGEKTRLVVDLSNATEGKVSIDPNQATMNPELPRRLKAVRMAPTRLDAKLERLAKRRLP